MVEIAQTFADSERYLNAAQDFRLPYWDYHLPRGYEAVFPGVTLGQDKYTGEFLNLEDVTIDYRTTGKQISDADVDVRTVKKDDKGNHHDVDVLTSTKFPYDFGIPQILMLEKVMMRLPNGKVKFEYNPLRTFWFPNNEEIPESHWESMGMTVSLLRISELLQSAHEGLRSSEMNSPEAIQCVIFCSDIKAHFKAPISE